MVENYLRQQFPDSISTKGDEANFRRASKKFSVANGQLMYKGNRLVVTDKRKAKYSPENHQICLFSIQYNFFLEVKILYQNKLKMCDQALIIAG